MGTIIYASFCSKYLVMSMVSEAEIYRVTPKINVDMFKYSRNNLP